MLANDTIDMDCVIYQGVLWSPSRCRLNTTIERALTT
jgi:hypothetical protein